MKKTKPRKAQDIKRIIRLKTLEVFYKSNQCEFCKKIDRHTTWHHKRYVLPPKLKRKDLIELCIECHEKLEQELMEKQSKGNMPPREERV